MGVTTFDWLDFGQGRARFSGSIRGADERGHETFAVEANGAEYFGEIDRAFLLNGNDYNMEIVSFGYTDKEYVSAPFPSARAKFTPADLEVMQLLICSLIEAVSKAAEKPYIMGEYADAHFMGKVIFREGWALVLSTSAAEGQTT